MPKLDNDAHEQFAKTYALDPEKKFNGAQAYKQAYPEAKDYSARTAASALLTKDNVKNRISELLDQSGLTLTKLNEKLHSLVEHAKSEDVQLRASRLGYELHGVLSKDSGIENMQNIQVNILQINNQEPQDNTQVIDTKQDTPLND